jgi:hypothetical protein
MHTFYRNYRTWLSTSAFKRCSLAAGILCSLFISAPVLYAQKTDRIQANTEKLHDLATRSRKNEATGQAKARQQFVKKNVALSGRSDDGSSFRFYHFSPNGHPVFVSTYNDVAAKTVSTNKVWPGGLVGYNLSGAGYSIGIWDAGAVMGNHIEFTGRVRQLDNAQGADYHATHVAGTLISRGINPSARGMAYEANLHAFDWHNDEAEMAEQAAAGLMVSNHSYGYLAGWHFNGTKNLWEWYGDTRIDTLKDHKFGFYDEKARIWDEIAYHAPYYLVVKAAGNERTHAGPGAGKMHHVYDYRRQEWVESTTTRPQDGPYDCITGSGNSKNILTIGAVHDISNGYQGPADARMANFSSWGPTDDGRIKPDLCGNGVTVFSTAAGNAWNLYVNNNGTSMASPNIAGSLLLLQQHYANTHSGQHMRAATLKGLAIHTADEAGPHPGPDYMFGWGVLNTAKAAEVISGDNNTHQIIEQQLDNQATYELFVTADATRPLQATLSWTDPAGTPLPAALDSRTPLLVNDLDIRIIDVETFEAYLPWRLDVENPSAAATQGDNLVDNVEQVQLSTPGNKVYLIQVTHKGILHNNTGQPFSLIVSGQRASAATACRGIITYNAHMGKLDDGSKTQQYLNNTDCMWKIKLPAPGRVALKFDAMDVAENDYVYVYDGETTSSRLIGRYSGTFLPDSIYSTGNSMLIHFISNNEGTAQGWQAGYSACLRPYVFYTVKSALSVSAFEFSNFSFGAQRYIWHYGNGDSSVTSAATHVYTYPRAGIYTATLTAINNCQRSSVSREINVQVVTNVPEPVIFSDKISVFPNPAHGNFTIELAKEMPQQLHLEVFTLSGQKIYDELFSSPGKPVSKRIEMPSAKAGIYILRLKGTDWVYHEKVLIQ